VGGDAAVGDLEPGPLHERLRRPLQGMASDERAHDHHGSIRRAQRLAHPGHGEDRADARDRVRRPDHDRLGRLQRARHLIGQLRLVGAAELDSLERRPGVLEDQVFLEVAPLALGLDVGLDRLVRHRKHRGSDVESGRERTRDLRQPLPLVEQLGAQEAGREVLVAEPEPLRAAELDELLERVLGLAGNPVAALLVDHAGEPVRDEVRVG